MQLSTRYMTSHARNVPGDWRGAIVHGAAIPLSRRFSRFLSTTVDSTDTYAQRGWDCFNMIALASYRAMPAVAIPPEQNDLCAFAQVVHRTPTRPLRRD